MCLFQIGPLCNSSDNLLFDHSNCRYSFQSLRKLFHHLSTIVGLIVCFSIFVVLALLLRYFLIDPFSTLLDLVLRHSLSQFLNPSRCSDQSHLSLSSAVALSELPGIGSSRVASCRLVVVVVLACAGDPSFLGLSLDGLDGSLGLTVAFLNVSALPLSVSHGNPCTSA